jgi:hypothetical protein
MSEQAFGNIMLIISIVFTTLFIDGILFLCYYFGVKRKANRWKYLLPNCLSASGIINNIVGKTVRDISHNLPPSESYSALYTFNDAQNICYKGRFPLKRMVDYKVGDCIKVYYNPQDPNENFTDRHLEENKLTSKIMIGLMTLIIIIPIFSAILSIWLSN